MNFPTIFFQLLLRVVYSIIILIKGVRNIVVSVINTIKRIDRLNQVYSPSDILPLYKDHRILHRTIQMLLI